MTQLLRLALHPSMADWHCERIIPDSKPNPRPHPPERPILRFRAMAWHSPHHSSRQRSHLPQHLPRQTTTPYRNTDASHAFCRIFRHHYPPMGRGSSYTGQSRIHRIPKQRRMAQLGSISNDRADWTRVFNDCFRLRRAYVYAHLEKHKNIPLPVLTPMQPKKLKMLHGSFL